jgi:hypothetical protein
MALNWTWLYEAFGDCQGDARDHESSDQSGEEKRAGFEHRRRAPRTTTDLPLEVPRARCGPGGGVGIDEKSLAKGHSCLTNASRVHVVVGARRLKAV